jgi:transcriptional regulator with XRE-family HTH domain
MLPAQCKAARALAGLEARELAALAMVSPDTVARFERGEALKPRTVAAIEAALVHKGVEFLGDTGVKIRKPRPDSPQARP